MSRKRVKDMQKKDEYCITAGEFAKMCQTTRDTLRYYERQGILVPKKNPVKRVSLLQLCADQLLLFYPNIP